MTHTHHKNGICFDTDHKVNGSQNKNISELYEENLLIVQGLEDNQPKTITEALLDAWDEFNHEINDRSPNKIFVDDYARVELFKMMVDIETDKARTSI